MGCASVTKYACSNVHVDTQYASKDGHQVLEIRGQLSCLMNQVFKVKTRVV